MAFVTQEHPIPIPPPKGNVFKVLINDRAERKTLCGTLAANGHVVWEERQPSTTINNLVSVMVCFYEIRGGS